MLQNTLIPKKDIFSAIFALRDSFRALQHVSTLGQCVYCPSCLASVSGTTWSTTYAHIYSPYWSGIVRLHSYSIHAFRATPWPELSSSECSYYSHSQTTRNTTFFSFHLLCHKHPPTSQLGMATSRGKWAFTFVSNANKRLGFIRRTLKLASRHTKLIVHKKLVRPKLEYACEVWDSYVKKNLSQNWWSRQRQALHFIYYQYWRQ